jgi:hypothetical protein
VAQKAGLAHSASFGHPTYVDIAAGGQNFTFDYPSTNTPAGVRAVLDNGAEIVYGDGEGSQGSLVCSAH